MNSVTADPIRHQRSQGRAHVALALHGARTRLAHLAQAGSARAIILAAPGRAGTASEDAGLEVVFLNTSGGLTGGDRLELSLELASDCRAVATTQTAERAYRAGSGCARMQVRHSLGAGAHLDWLPQETILYEASALERRTEIVLMGDASCLTLETVVLGRAAMGEMPARLFLSDHRAITRDGQPIWLEPLVLDQAALAAGSAVLGGARAFASLVLVARGAEDRLASARDALHEPGVTGGASGFDGKLVVRLMASESWPLRRQIARLLETLRQAPLPRVWQMAGGSA
ncbi:MAG: urease accessory protein UreD [Pararhodobacter sp.]